MCKALHSLFKAIYPSRANCSVFFKLVAAGPDMTCQRCSKASHLFFLTGKHRDEIRLYGWAAPTMGVTKFKDLPIFNNVLKSSVEFHVGWTASWGPSFHHRGRSSSFPDAAPSNLIHDHGSWRGNMYIFYFIFADTYWFSCCCWKARKCVFFPLSLSLIFHPFVSKCQEQRAVGVMFKYNRHVRRDTPLWTIWSVLPTAVAVI